MGNGRGTMTGLVEDLLRKHKDPLREELLTNARRGLYHDFKSPLPTPKIRLVTDLERYGYRDLARNARRNEYADEPDAAEQAEVDAFAASDPRLGEIHRKVMAGEFTPEEGFAAVASALNLSPEDQALMAAEIENMPEAPAILARARAGGATYETTIRTIADKTPMTDVERRAMEKRTGVRLPRSE